ncbi:DUF4258 domain-containing protein [Acetobacterium malicum]|uniref:DUF4258 domain-containing protein n=1 Tax=Acetobacterium malicum TaxID=52692 RepID=UPI0004791B92|nr:DUF4258 domain-containing protein [Acetobacterium dehalogenans]
MKIEELKELYEKDFVFLTQHVIERCKQRDIRPKHIRIAVMTGEIIEDYPDDFPTPSCLILGYITPDTSLHVVIASNGESAKIVTAYYPDKDKWESDMKTRKECLK